MGPIRQDATSQTLRLLPIHGIWATQSRGAAWHPLRAQHPDPEGVPRVPVTDIVRSLQLFLDELGCLVREVADGWALLRSGPFALLLIHEPTPTDPARLQPSSDPPTAEVRPAPAPSGCPRAIPPLIRLFTPDVHTLRRRLNTHAPHLDSCPSPHRTQPTRSRCATPTATASVRPSGRPTAG